MTSPEPGPGAAVPSPDRPEAEDLGPEPEDRGPAPAGPAPAGPPPAASPESPTGQPSPRAGSEPMLPEQSREDTDAAWGEYPESARDRLYRDRPPHWDDY
jgi:hypothetical protein